MSNQPEVSTAPAAVSSRKLRQLLRTRVRQLFRLFRAFAICLTLAALVGGIWWLTSLNGLPDIGDPFDLADIEARPVPDDRNAFTLLQRAKESVKGEPSFGPVISWSQADPKLRAWVDANGRALDLFRQGADQPDAVYPIRDLSAPGARVDDVIGRSIGVRYLIVLAALEGSKRQESADAAGAWDCYRAVLRMNTHVCRRGDLAQRFEFKRGMDWLSPQLASWASNPSTTITLLHTALDEALANEPKSEWDTFAIKLGYVEVLRSLEQPVNRSFRREMEGEPIYRVGDLQLTPELVEYIQSARFVLRREDERTRRIVRLLCANSLQRVESSKRSPGKPSGRAAPARNASTDVRPHAVGASARAGTLALTSEEIASWLLSSREAQLRLSAASMFGWPWPPDRLAHRRAYRQLVVMLATEIYRRERGALPASEDALVGTYLEHLPDDGAGNVEEQTVPQGG